MNNLAVVSLTDRHCCSLTSAMRPNLEEILQEEEREEGERGIIRVQGKSGTGQILEFM